VAGGVYGRERPGSGAPSPATDGSGIVTDIHRALALLRSGDWEAAHGIVQEDDSVLACWAHGIVHLMEGDEGNAGYWYRRAGRALPPASAARIDAELDALGAALSGAQQ
tara:strand:+ start:203 stop:529 length:327 start_codon:yes stop_codon:yes gene_type:complete